MAFFNREYQTVIETLRRVRRAESYYQLAQSSEMRPSDVRLIVFGLEMLGCAKITRTARNHIVDITPLGDHFTFEVTP